MILFSFTLLALIGNNASAGAKDAKKNLGIRPSCPVPHPTYESLIDNLRSFRSSAFPKEGCMEVKAKLQNLELLSSSNERLVIQNLVQTSTVSATSPSQAQTIMNYNRSLSDQVLGLMRALKKERDCVNSSDTPALLNSVASLVQESTSAAATFTGPYSIPIAIGGSAFASILKLVNEVIDDIRGGYDFDNLDHRQLYIRSLCVFQDIRREIDGSLEPEAQMKLYERYNSELEIKLLKISAATPIYPPLDLTYVEVGNQLYAATSQLKTLIEKTSDHIQSTESLKGFAACSSLSDLLRRKSSPLQAQRQRIRSDEEVLRDLAPNDFLQVTSLDSALSELIPDLENCLADRLSERLEAVNASSRQILRDLNRRSLALYERAHESLVEKAKDKVIDLEGRPINPVEWLDGTLERKMWGERQIARLKQLVGSRSDSLRMAIMRDQEDLSHRFYENLSPRFLNWHIRAGEKTLKNLEGGGMRGSSIHSTTRVIVRAIAKSHSGISPASRKLDLPQALSAITVSADVLPDSDYQNIYSNVSKLVPQLNTVGRAQGTLESYCRYFRDNGSYGHAIRSVCEGKNYTEMQRAYQKHLPLVGSLHNYLQWCRRAESRKVKLDGIDAIIEDLQACHSTLPMPSQASDS